MVRQSRNLAVLAALAAVMLQATAARAQYYGAAAPPPLYPYAMQNSVQADQPYAVEVAPNTYMIQRSAPQRSYPYVRSRTAGRGIVNTAVGPAEGKFDRPHKPVDRALVEELRQRHRSKDNAVTSEKIVRDPPVVRETRRVVNDPPRIIERRTVVDDESGTVETEQPVVRGDNKKRVIQADAEVTILGPDRMSIRLFRKGQGRKANTRAD
jgi:hypothetical protein